MNEQYINEANILRGKLEDMHRRALESESRDTSRDLQIDRLKKEISELKIENEQQKHELNLQKDQSMLEKDFAEESRRLREAMIKIERQHVKELGELNIYNQQLNSQIKGLQKKLQDSYQENERLQDVFELKFVN